MAHVASTEPPPPVAGRKRPAADQSEGSGNRVGHDGTQQHEPSHELHVKYRTMLEDIEANKEQLSRPEDTGLLESLQKQDKLFEGGAARCCECYLTTTFSTKEPTHHPRRARL